MPASADFAQHLLRLQAALETADRVFAGMPQIGVVDGCTYCYSPHDLDVLGGDPAAVPDELVRHFAAEIPEHWSAEQHGQLWRGLATRILRTAADNPEKLIIPWALRGPGAPEARFHQWPHDQQEALIAAYSALLAVAVVSWPAQDVVELLGPLAYLHDDIAPWFAQINAMTGPSADAGLVRLSVHWALELLWDNEPHWYWYPDNPVGLVAQWLCSPAVRERLASFAQQHPACENAADALTAVDALAAAGYRPLEIPKEGLPADGVVPMSRTEDVPLTSGMLREAATCAACEVPR